MILAKVWPQHDEWMSGYVDYKVLRIGPVALSMHPPEQYEHSQWILSLDWGRLRVRLHLPEIYY